MALPAPDPPRCQPYTPASSLPAAAGSVPRRALTSLHFFLFQYPWKNEKVAEGGVSKMAWREITRRAISAPTPQANSSPGLCRFFSKSSPYLVNVGIPEFLNGIGKGVEAHIPKFETEIGDIQKLLVTRTLKLKKLGIPCQHRKLILNFAHKYRLGLWRPRAQPAKPK